MKKSDDKTKIGITTNTFLSQIADYSFNENLNRVKYLVDLGNEIYKQTGKSNRKNSKEILRAATVLLHASMEDLLRFICVSFIDKNNKEIIDKIPLINNSNNGRAEKITLGSLIPHKDKKIHDLISESIKDYYNHFVSFNSTNEISNHLEKIGVNISSINQYYKVIDDLIKRRHSIVHHADLINTELRTTVSERVPAPISQHEVKKWIKTIDNFGLQIFKILSGNEYDRKTNPMIKTI